MKLLVMDCSKVFYFYSSFRLSPCYLLRAGSLLLVIFGLVSWDAKANASQTNQSTAAANVQVLSKIFEMPGLNRTRQVRIYLPPNYSVGEQSYPVIYMHDAQNLFDQKTSYVGEWGVDESLNRLHTEKRLSFIVVGIDNGQSKRINELSPWENSKYGAAEGEGYMKFVVEVIKPYIDKQYRTLPDKKNTAIIGSSMGGLISHYAMLNYSDVFSKAGIFSPSFWYSEKVYQFSKEKQPEQNARLFYLMGGKEGAKSIANMNKMVVQLKQQGHPSNNIYSNVVEGGEHNEGFWREHFARAVLWLFEK
jgi:predicted alpha/beta superfamily hydrolase